MTDPIDEIEARTALSGLAKIIRHYYASLVEEGFAPMEALALTIAYQQAMQRPQS